MAAVRLVLPPNMSSYLLTKYLQKSAEPSRADEKTLRGAVFILQCHQLGEVFAFRAREDHSNRLAQLWSVACFWDLGLAWPKPLDHQVIRA